MASAVGGNGGDKWGAFGGSAVQPSAPQNLQNALSTATRQTNHELNVAAQKGSIANSSVPLAARVPDVQPNTLDVLSEMSAGRLRADSRNGDILDGPAFISQTLPVRRTAVFQGVSTAGNPTEHSISPPVGPNCTLLGSTAVPGFAIPGCMIPGVNFQ